MGGDRASRATQGAASLPRPPSRYILGMRVDRTSHGDAVDRIVTWAARGEGRYVCIATVNNVMESYDDKTFQDVMNGADLVTPDGMPLAWGLRLLGLRSAPRVAGPDLTPRLLSAAASSAQPVALFGGTPEVAASLAAWAQERFPGLEIAYRFSPPFRTLTSEEEAAIMSDIEASGARIVLVGLGCPKQERFMARNVGRAPAVLVGVGAAFDFLVGQKRRAPMWMQRSGLEWVFRLWSEPGRLWRRYARHNPRFMALFAGQLARDWMRRWYGTDRIVARGDQR